MKQLGYYVFAGIYNLHRKFAKMHNKVVLFNGHNHGLNGNLELVSEEITKRDQGCQIVAFSKQDLFHPNGGICSKIKGILCFFVKVPWNMADAGKIFLNDNLLPLAYMHTEGQQIIQLWHGAGAFKRFGLSTEEDPNVRKQVAEANKHVTHLFVTSTQIIPYYSEAFAIPTDRIYATGIPVLDAYFDEEDKKRRAENVYRQYPVLRDKKVLLYAPTFRAKAEENAQLLEKFDIAKICQTLGDDWYVLVKLHPKFPSENITLHEHCLNMTDYSDITDLYMVADCLVTDYSSTVVEYVLLDKPIILFAYDLDKYDRGFYRDYRSTVPGDIAYSTEELLQLLQKNVDNAQKRQDFAKLQYDYIEGGSLERVFAILQKE